MLEPGSISVSKSWKRIRTY